MIDKYDDDDGSTPNDDDYMAACQSLLAPAIIIIGHINPHL